MTEPGDYIKHPNPANMTTCCEDNGGSSGTGSNLHGDGAPDVSLGSNGDTYVDDLTGDLYWKGGGTWHP